VNVFRVGLLTGDYPSVGHPPIFLSENAVWDTKFSWSDLYIAAALEFKDEASSISFGAIEFVGSRFVDSIALPIVMIG
jgi:hypothetical protein